MTRYNFKARKITGGGPSDARDSREDGREERPRNRNEQRVDRFARPMSGKGPVPRKPAFERAEREQEAAFPHTRGRKVRPEPTAPREKREIVRGGKTGFASVLRETAREMGLLSEFRPEPSPLAGLEYKQELELKNAALRRFWATHQIPDKPNLVLPSPSPRHYRSTSKRRLIFKGGRWNWDFFSDRPAEEALTRKKAEEDWSLEPEAHQAVYRKALDKLREAPYQGLAHSLNFLIVRGGEQLMVLFNVHKMSAEVVRKAKMLAEHIMAEEGAKVVSAHLFFDPSKSSYYLEAKGPVHSQRLKRLVGPEFLPIDVAGRRYFLHPLGFFQVNLGILPRVIDEVQRALKPGKGDRLLDLFCGCGLFTLPVGADCKDALGVEFSPVAIDAAQLATGHAKARNLRFRAGKLEVARLHKLIPEPDGTPELLLLDPPAQGTSAGLIRALAERKPQRVAHLFCGMDALPTEINTWRKQGYMVAKAIPFDMFPGTDNLEVLIVLIPDKYGILNRKKVKVDPVDEYVESQALRARGNARPAQGPGRPGAKGPRSPKPKAKRK